MLTRFSRRLLLSGILASSLSLTWIHTQAQPSAPETPAPVYKLKRLLIADTEAKVSALRAATDAGPVVAQDMPLLATQAFAETMRPCFGQIITTALVNKIAAEIQKYMRAQDRLVVNTIIPTQDIAAGELRLAVVIGRYNQLRFQGNRWFSRELLTERLGVKPGDEVRLSTLEEAVNWTNANPFRRVKVLVNDLYKTDPGHADLLVNVQERFPVRMAAAYDDTGNEAIGRSRYTVSAQFGNLWGLDHQGSYQYTTTEPSHLYQAHSVDYRVPLPWRHYLQLAGAYGLVRPTFGGGWFSQEGKSTVASLRYIAPVERSAYSLEYSAGLDFKQSNNNLEFGGTQILTTTTDVFQLTLGGTAIRRDAAGAWVFGASVNISPGGVNSRNSDASFQEARYGAKARYVQGSLVMQRLTKLPASFLLFSRGQLQKTSANLIGSEQFTIGGQGTVRGYDERILSGDEGFLLSNELQGPIWKTALAAHGRPLPPMESRLVAFWDYAKTWYKHPIGSDIKLDPLMSVGLGVRCNVGNYFNLSADYGRQLLATSRPQPNRGRFHVRATIAY